MTELIAVTAKIKTIISTLKAGMDLYNQAQEKRLNRFYKVLARSIDDSELDEKTANRLNNLQFDEKMAEKIYQQARRALLAESNLVVGTIALVTSYLFVKEEESYHYTKFLRILQNMTDDEIIFLDTVVATYQAIESRQTPLPSGKQYSKEQLANLHEKSLVIEISKVDKIKSDEIMRALRAQGALGLRTHAGTNILRPDVGGKITDDTLTLIGYYRKAQKFEQL